MSGWHVVGSKTFNVRVIGVRQPQPEPKQGGGGVGSAKLLLAGIALAVMMGRGK